MSSELTKDQKTEIVQFCEKNQDTDFEVIATRFSDRFKVELTKNDINGLYMDALVR